MSEARTPARSASPQPARILTWVVVGCLLAAALVWRWQQPQLVTAEERWKRADAALAARDWKVVEEEAVHLATYPDFEAQAALLQGSLLAKEQKPEALPLLKAAAREPALRLRSLVTTGELLYLVGRIPQAAEVLREAVDLEPDSVDAQRWLASCYYDLGLNELTLQHLNRVSSLAPEDGRPHRQMGLMHKDFEYWEQAVKDYDEALRRQPDAKYREEVLLELAECQTKLFRYDDALKTLALAKPSVERSALEAECHLAQGRASEATELLHKALAEQPNHRAAGLLLAKLQLDEGQPAKAEELLRKIAAANPPDFEISFQLSQALRQAGKTAEADAEARHSEELKQVRERFSKLHARAGEHPNDPEVRFELGKVALEMGRPDLAGMWFQSALSLSPQHAAALEALQALAKRETSAQPRP